MNVLMVGTALDTNGQKSRFVDAARRWASDPDVLKALVVGSWDGAGIPTRLAQAAQKIESGLAIRSAHRATAYFNFPTDIIWSRQTHSQVQELADQADVIHLTNDVKAYVQLRLPRLRKPAVLHHHGTLFRSLHDNGASRDRLLSEAERHHMVSVVSTIDLLRYAPDVLHWMPAPIDMDAMRTIRDLERRIDDGVVRIMSAPTRRDLKSTDRLRAAVEQLKAEGLATELVLVEQRSWAECLAMKGTADIYFDQVAVPSQDYPGGYGCNAIEAWGMGIPVVAGADEWTTNRMRQEFGDRLPFYEATEDTITDALRALVKSKRLRSQWGRIGRDHAEKYHAEKPTLIRLAELYAEAIRVRTLSKEVVDDIPLTPGRFRTEGRQNLTIRLASRTVQFREGEVTITDPELARRLRRRIQFDRHYRISEVLA